MVPALLLDPSLVAAARANGFSPLSNANQPLATFGKQALISPDLFPIKPITDYQIKAEVVNNAEETERRGIFRLGILNRTFKLSAGLMGLPMFAQAAHRARGAFISATHSWGYVLGRENFHHVWKNHFAHWAWDWFAKDQDVQRAFPDFGKRSYGALKHGEKLPQAAFDRLHNFIHQVQTVPQRLSHNIAPQAADHSHHILLNTHPMWNGVTMASPPHAAPVLQSPIETVLRVTHQFFIGAWDSALHTVWHLVTTPSGLAELALAGAAAFVVIGWLAPKVMSRKTGDDFRTLKMRQEPVSASTESPAKEVSVLLPEGSLAPQHDASTALVGPIYREAQREDDGRLKVRAAGLDTTERETKALVKMGPLTGRKPSVVIPFVSLVDNTLAGLRQSPSTTRQTNGTATAARRSLRSISGPSAQEALSLQPLTVVSTLPVALSKLVAWVITSFQDRIKINGHFTRRIPSSLPSAGGKRNVLPGAGLPFNVTQILETRRDANGSFSPILNKPGLIAAPEVAAQVSPPSVEPIVRATLPQVELPAEVAQARAPESPHLKIDDDEVYGRKVAPEARTAPPDSHRRPRLRPIIAALGVSILLSAAIFSGWHIHHSEFESARAKRATVTQLLSGPRSDHSIQAHTSRILSGSNPKIARADLPSAGESFVSRARASLSARWLTLRAQYPLMAALKWSEIRGYAIVMLVLSLMAWLLSPAKQQKHPNAKAEAATAAGYRAAAAGDDLPDLPPGARLELSSLYSATKLLYEENVIHMTPTELTRELKFLEGQFAEQRSHGAMNGPEQEQATYVAVHLQALQTFLGQLQKFEETMDGYWRLSNRKRSKATMPTPPELSKIELQFEQKNRDNAPPNSPSVQLRLAGDPLSTLLRRKIEGRQIDRTERTLFILPEVRAFLTGREGKLIADETIGKVRAELARQLTEETSVTANPELVGLLGDIISLLEELESKRSVSIHQESATLTSSSPEKKITASGNAPKNKQPPNLSQVYVPQTPEIVPHDYRNPNLHGMEFQEWENLSQRVSQLHRKVFAGPGYFSDKTRILFLLELRDFYQARTNFKTVEIDPSAYALDSDLTRLEDLKPTVLRDEWRSLKEAVARASTALDTDLKTEVHRGNRVIAFGKLQERRMVLSLEPVPEAFSLETIEEIDSTIAQMNAKITTWELRNKKTIPRYSPQLSVGAVVDNFDKDAKTPSNDGQAEGIQTTAAVWGAGVLLIIGLIAPSFGHVSATSVMESGMLTTLGLQGFYPLLAKTGLAPQWIRDLAAVCIGMQVIVPRARRLSLPIGRIVSLARSSIVLRRIFRGFLFAAVAQAALTAAATISSKVLINIDQGPLQNQIMSLAFSTAPWIIWGGLFGLYAVFSYLNKDPWERPIFFTRDIKVKAAIAFVLAAAGSMVPWTAAGQTWIRQQFKPTQEQLQLRIQEKSQEEKEQEGRRVFEAFNELAYWKTTETSEARQAQKDERLNRFLKRFHVIFLGSEVIVEYLQDTEHAIQLWHWKEGQGITWISSRDYDYHIELAPHPSPKKQNQNIGRIADRTQANADLPVMSSNDLKIYDPTGFFLFKKVGEHPVTYSLTYVSSVPATGPSDKKLLSKTVSTKRPSVGLAARPRVTRKMRQIQRRSARETASAA